MLDLVTHGLLNLNLVLDEGDAQNLDNRRKVAQRLRQPEPLRIRHVLAENSTDQLKLRAQGHKDLWLVESLLDVAVEQAFVLGVDSVEEVNHEEKDLEGHILPFFFLLHVLRHAEVARRTRIMLVLERHYLECAVQDLAVINEQLDGVVLDQLTQFEKHPVRVLQRQLVRLFHADHEVYDADDAVPVRDKLGQKAEGFTLTVVEHEGLQLRLVAELLGALD